MYCMLLNVSGICAGWSISSYQMPQDNPQDSLSYRVSGDERVCVCVAVPLSTC